MESFFTLLWMVVCIVVIIGLAYFFTKYMAGSGRLGGVAVSGKNARIKVLAQLTVGKDRQLLLVQLGQRYFLLGNASAEITTLAELSQEDIEKWQNDEGQRGGSSPSFMQAMRTVWKQKGRGDKS